ncbi:hypothetical protein QJQ45_021861 [Haematococcus lacustris]|nr:hypothetical protein QJQ45_021861 [Haematococcus lacustris]
MLSCCWRSSNVTQPLVRKSPEATDIQQLLNPLQGIQQANVQEKDNELWDECLDALECVESFEEQEESDDEVENAGVRQLASETTRHNIERKLRQERRLQQKRLAEEVNACQRAKSQGMLTLDRKPSQLVSRSGRSALSHGMLLEACSHSVAHEPSPSADVVMQLSLASLPSKPTVGYKAQESMGTLEHGPAQALPHPSPLKDDEDRVWQQVLRLKQEWRDEAAGAIGCAVINLVGASALQPQRKKRKPENATDGGSTDSMDGLHFLK